MSFSTEVKNELFQMIPKARHCRIAELAAAIRFIGEVSITDKEKKITLQTENVTLAKLCIILQLRIGQQFVDQFPILNDNAILMQLSCSCTTSNVQHDVPFEGSF